jgi:hypothetical protein
VRFGIIGAGSANSIVSSVFGINDCATAALHISIGKQHKYFNINLICYFNRKQMLHRCLRRLSGWKIVKIFG